MQIFKLLELVLETFFLVEGFTRPIAALFRLKSEVGKTVVYRT